MLCQACMSGIQELTMIRIWAIVMIVFAVCDSRTPQHSRKVSAMVTENAHLSVRE